MIGTNLVEMARLAETYGDGEIRLTTDQNLILTGVPEENLAGLLAEPLLQTHSPNPKPFERGVVACTGNEFCRLAIVETKARALQWAQELDRRVTIDGADIIRLHFSGCSASCAQPQIADVGFRGETAKTADAIVEGVDIGLGGSLGRDAAFIDWVEGAKPVTEVPDAMVRLFDRYAEERREGERFYEWARRMPNDGAADDHRRNGEVTPVTAAFAIRDEMNDIDEAPGKVWFWELERAVIDAGRCMQCGVCIAACPSDSLGIGADDLPKLVKMCTGCSLCWDFCPGVGCGTRRSARSSPVCRPTSMGAEWRCGRERSCRVVGGLCHSEAKEESTSEPVADLQSSLLRLRRIRRRDSSCARNDTTYREWHSRNGMVTATGMVTGGAATSLEAARERFTARVTAVAPRRAGRRRGLGAADRVAGERGDRRRAGGEAERARAVERRGAPRPDAGGRHRLRRQLLQPDAGAGAPRSQEVRPAAETAHRPRRHPLRDPGLAGDAGSGRSTGGRPRSMPSS